MRKRFLGIALAIGLLSGIIAAGIYYFRFVSYMIYEESANHLLEIYGQANRSLHDLATHNWKVMRLWALSLPDVQEEEKVKKYVQELQDEIGFTEFYFLSCEGTFHTIEGTEGKLDMQDRLDRLITEGEPVVVNSALFETPGVVLFAVPASQGNYQGFEYESIAVSFSSGELIAAMDVPTFDGRSDSYIVYSDGRVLIDNTDNREHSFYNFVSMLETDSDMSEKQIDGIRQALQQGQEGVSAFRLGKEKYYLVYEPVDFEDWMVLGLVPSDVVNASMNRLQTITLAVVIGITASLGMVLLVFLIRQSRKSLEKKDTEDRKSVV